MRRIHILSTVALAASMGAAVVTAASTGFAAGSAHFIKNATSASLSGSSLKVSFKEAGLSSGSVETIKIDATATTTYECVNGGGKNPSASNKTTTVTDVSASGTFTADRNGNITGSEAMAAPTASQLGFACPSGQRVTFVSVSYTNVSVSDLTSGASLALPGTFSASNPSAP